jgi:prevent-host-death family protein
MAHLVNLYEAKTQLSALVDQVSEGGEEIIIAKNGTPMAKLVRFQARKVRKAGGWEGKVWFAPDFYEPTEASEIRPFYENDIFPR